MLAKVVRPSSGRVCCYGDVATTPDIKRTHTRQSGFVLISTLFAIALLALFTVATIRISAVQSALNDRYIKQQIFDVTVPGLLDLAAWDASQLRFGASLKKESRHRQLALGEHTFDFVVRNAAGLIDLNTGSLELLERYLSARHGSGFAAEAIAAVRLRRARHDTFEDVDHFMLPDGIAVQEERATRRFLTIHSGRRGLHPESAPDELLSFLKIDRDQVPRPWRSRASPGIYLVTISNTEFRLHKRFAILLKGSGKLGFEVISDDA